MTNLEASIQLRLALACVLEVRAELSRDEMPGRDARWVLSRVESDLADAIARLDPVKEEDDERPLSPLARDVFELGLAHARLAGGSR